MTSSTRSLPPLGTLVAFDAAARLRSFTAAAAELNLTQAAVSRQMRTLEADLCTTLFVRGRRSVALTADGEALLHAVRPSLARLRAAAAELRARDRALSVFSELGLATGWLVPRLSSFLMNHPHIEVRLVTSDEPVEHVHQRFDLALQTGRRAVAGMRVERLDDEELLAVCAPGIFAALGPDADIGVLNAAPLIDMEWQRHWAGWREFFEAHGAHAPSRRAPLRFTNYAVMLDAVRRGHGVGLAWGHSVSQDLAQGTLIRACSARIDFADGVCAYVSDAEPTRSEVTLLLRELGRTI